MSNLEFFTSRSRPKEVIFVWVLNLIFLGLGNVYGGGPRFVGYLIALTFLQIFIMPHWAFVPGLFVRMILYVGLSIKGTADAYRYNSRLKFNDPGALHVLPTASNDSAPHYASDHFEAKLRSVQNALSGGPPTDTLNKLHELSHRLSEHESGSHRSQPNSAPLTLYDELMLARQEAQTAAAAQEVTGVQLSDPRCEPEEPAESIWNAQSYQSAVYPQAEPVAPEPQLETDSSQDAPSFLPPTFPGSTGVDTEVQLGSSAQADGWQSGSLGQAMTGEPDPPVPFEVPVAASPTNTDNADLTGSNLSCSHCGANRTLDFSFCMNCGHTYDLS